MYIYIYIRVSKLNAEPETEKILYSSIKLIFFPPKGENGVHLGHDWRKPAIGVQKKFANMGGTHGLKSFEQ